MGLTKGYHQLLIDQESREVTAFSTPEGLYQWKVLPLGMKTSGAAFQRVMDKIFEKLQPSKVVVYIDDVTVLSPTMEQHLADLDEVFQRIHQAGLKISYSKCKIAQTEVKVLGHHISEKGIRPSEDKVKAVLQIAPPTTVRGIKSFLGMLVFYQRFIPKLAITAAPLWKLCKKNVPFKWEGAEQEAFLKLKQCLSEAPVVRLPQ